MPWQQFAILEAMRLEETSYKSKLVAILVARQNGKSHLVRIRIIVGMLLWGERWIGMAQNLALAEEHLDWTIALFERFDWLQAEVKKVSRTNGKKFLELKNGGKWSVIAANKEAARGHTGNLWIDEIREMKSDAWKAATPVTRAVLNSQTWVTSNAGDDHSTVLNRLRKTAMAAKNEDFLWMEWSADPALAMNDRRGWYQANPALGWRIDESKIALALETDSSEEFRTETLCQWIDALESPWTTGSLLACADAELVMDQSAATYWSVDVTPDRRRADLVGAQELPDGRIGFTIAQSWEATQAVDDLAIASDIAEILRQFNTQLVAFDKWTSGAIAQRMASAGFVVVESSGSIFAQACDEMLTGLNSQRLIHDGNAELVAHFNACAKKNTGDGGWRVIRNGSATHISAACAAIMAVHHANKIQTEPSVMH
jgi:phage terminase large subunit-like protein